MVSNPCVCCKEMYMNKKGLSYQNLLKKELNGLHLLQLTLKDGNPLQCSCLENPKDGRAWWAAVYGVAESDMTEAT